MCGWLDAIALDESDALAGDAEQVLFIGGRPGVGKRSLVSELHGQLARQQVKHAVIEGDGLDLAYPPGWEHLLAERNLAAIWNTYRELGYRRLIYSNTGSVCQVAGLVEAIGGRPKVAAVLLTAGDRTAAQRLAGRVPEHELAGQVEHGNRTARRLTENTPGWVNRIDTENRSVAGLAVEVLQLTGWSQAAGTARSG